jgi:hypothetical protein
LRPLTIGGLLQRLIEMLSSSALAPPFDASCGLCCESLPSGGRSHTAPPDAVTVDSVSVGEVVAHA